MKRNPIETVLGVLVVAIAVMFLGFAYSTANVPSVRGYEITADFLKVGGLERGSDVRMSGIPIGTVTAENLDPKSFLARVTMTVSGNLQLPTDTQASIVSDGLLGSKYVNLIPGQASDHIPAGGKIAKTQDYQSLEDLVGQVIFLATQPANNQDNNAAKPQDAPQVKFAALSGFMLGLFLCLPAYATDIQNDTVVLGGLDKVSGQVNTIKGRVGQTLTFGKLQIVVRTCVTHPPEERPENAAFLEITQPQPKDPPQLLFSGWMFASNPAISAMDNPVYDVWVLRCENSAPSNSH